ncbi:hypothetical protein CEXT_88381 [Caerostris extrusa]|uniref:Uncharacterized protein n=1 Tax=Caerostris extrusa TaxID=172846 RepID=A0AAV4MDV0_CAEEX|nr:hypothetical protein CEXT_88381 [Caerostris extrusa]
MFVINLRHQWLTSPHINTSLTVWASKHAQGCRFGPTLHLTPSESAPGPIPCSIVKPLSDSLLQHPRAGVKGAQVLLEEGSGSFLCIED